MKQYFYSILLLSSYLLSIQVTLVPAQGSSISFSPDTPLCNGNVVEMVCFVESSEQFGSSLARVSFNSSMNIFEIVALNLNTVMNGVDLSRYTANTNGLTITSTRPGIRVIINSYLPSDSNTVIGCHGQFFNGSESSTLVSGQPNPPAAPPSAPSLQSSVSNFNTATCSADISLSWNTPPSNRTVDRYFLYLDGSPLFTTNSNSSIHSTILNINTDYQYSVTAMSCAGNSTISSTNVNSVKSYSFTVNNPLPQCLSYDNNTAVLTVNWELDMPSQPTGVSGLDITYSLRLMYTHSREGVAYSFSNSTNFTQLSSQLSFNTILTPHNFTNPQGVETNITAHLRILQQCRQDLVGAELSCSFSSVTPPPVIPTSSPIPPSSIPSSSSSTSIQIPPTPSVTPTTTSPPNTGAAALDPAIIGGAIGGIIVALVILVIVLILLGLCIYCLKKRDQDPKESDRFNMGGFDVNQSKESVDRQPEATYSQVNKPSKPEQPLYADIKKPQKELLYADLEHVTPTAGLVKAPTVPTTHYADLAQFSHSEQTQYSTVQDTMH